MKKFTSTLAGGQPALRLGAFPPPGTAVLGYIKNDELTAKAAVKATDLSTSLPQNSAVLQDFTCAVYPNADGKLVNPLGHASFPSDNIYLSDRFTYDSSGQKVALFFEYEAKHYHYEESITSALSEVDPLDHTMTHYMGHKIRVFQDGAEIKEGFRIYIFAHPDASAENTDPSFLPNKLWRILIYTNFSGSSSTRYTIGYNRWDETASRVVLGHQEALNMYPYFNKVTDQGSPEANVTYLQTQEDYAKLFATRPDPASPINAVNVYVSTKAHEFTRNDGGGKVLFRWRIKRDSSKYTPWRSEEVYSLDSITLGEQYDRYGVLVYKQASVGGSTRMLKRIMESPYRAFSDQTKSHTYTVEVERWSSGAWVANGGVVKVAAENPLTGAITDITASNTSLDEGNLHVFITTANETTATDGFPYTIEQLGYKYMLKVEGFLDPVTNAGTVTSNCLNEAVFSDLSLSCPLNSSDATPVKIWDTAGTAADMFTNHSGFVAYRTSASKSEAEAVINGNLDRVTSTISFKGSARKLKEFFITMGPKGSIEKVEICGSTGNVLVTILPADLTLIAPDYHAPVDHQTTRQYKWTYQSADDGTYYSCYSLKFYFRASNPWMKMHATRYEQKRGITHGYGYELDVMGIEVWERFTSADSDWSKTVYIQGSTTESTEVRIPWKSWVEENMPDATSTGSFHYEADKVYFRVSQVAGDADNCHVTPGFFQGTRSDGKYIFAEGTGVVTLKKTQPGLDLDKANGWLTDDTFLVIRAEGHKVIQSYPYQMRTTGNSRIYLYPFEEEDHDQMWFAKVHCGEFSVFDDLEGSCLDYRLPEFENQPFRPTFPYERAIKDRATIINAKHIRVKFTPLRFPSSPDIQVYVNGALANTTIPGIVRDYDAYSGDIFLEGIELDPMDQVEVSYIYKKEYYTYKGYGTYNADGTLASFFHLDLNPLPGHTYFDPGDSSWHDSSTLLTKDIYIYALPASTRSWSSTTGVVNDTPDEVLNGVLRHAIVAAGAAFSFPEGALPLSKLQVRNPFIPSRSVVIDARTRGGGFKEELSTAELEKLIAKNDSYWDVSSWDGSIYPCNGVVVVELPQEILEAYGGKFTEEEVREAVMQYLDFGAYPIIRYKRPSD